MINTKRGERVRAPLFFLLLLLYFPGNAHAWAARGNLWEIDRRERGKLLRRGIYKTGNENQWARTKRVREKDGIKGTL